MRFSSPEFIARGLADPQRIQLMIGFSATAFAAIVVLAVLSFTGDQMRRALYNHLPAGLCIQKVESALIMMGDNTIHLIVEQRWIFFKLF